PGTGAAGTGGHRGPGVADAVPVCALLPKHGPVSHDRLAGAGGAALRPRRVLTAEAAQAGGVRGAVWSAPAGGRAPLCCAPLAPTDGRLRPPDYVARAAEAADLARLADDPAAHRRPAARALCDGRPALGRSVHAGAAQPPGRSRPHRPHPDTLHLSARLPPPPDGPGPSPPPHGQPLAPTTGRGGDPPGGPRQDFTCRGGRAD